ncbi:MAG: hypothetical protein KatS3mg032_0152 [Cyclobacteriaceae bacterium]|nr:MAG: hypothetical protein KatS3mg032_0152 [Cyclobacteriaceae bacterium]
MFTSTQDSNGYGDIRYYGNSPDSLPPADTVIAFKANSYPAMSGSLRVYGTVTDARTGQAINARITFTSVDRKWEVLSAPSQAYSLVIPSSGRYTIEVQASRYLTTYEQLDLETPRA